MKRLILILGMLICALLSYSQSGNTVVCKDLKTNRIWGKDINEVLMENAVRLGDTLWFPDGSYMVTAAVTPDTLDSLTVTVLRTDTIYFPDGTYFTSADGRGVINVNHTNYLMQDIDRVVSDSAYTYNDTIRLPANPTPGWFRTVIQTNGGNFYSVIDGNGKRIHLSWQYYKVSSTNPTTLIYNQDRDKYEFVSERIDAMGIDTNSLPIDDLIQWWCADSIALSNLDPVPLWEDLSGTGNDGTQSTLLSQPILQTNQVNSHAAVFFDGSDDTLSLGGMYDGSGYITAIVCKKYDAASHMPFYGSGVRITGVLNDLSYYWWDFSTGCGQAKIDAIDLSSYSILTVKIDNDSVYLYIDSEIIDADNIGNCPSAMTYFGWGYPNRMLHGWIAEVIHYHTTSNITLTRTNRYLANKYNIH